jgi:hypothetical protein
MLKHWRGADDNNNNNVKLLVWALTDQQPLRGEPAGSKNPTKESGWCPSL